MSINNFNRSKLKYVTCSHYYHILSFDQDPYWDDGIKYHIPKGHLSMITHKYKKKVIPIFKVREYRSWKYNRKTQWK